MLKKLEYRSKKVLGKSLELTWKTHVNLAFKIFGLCMCGFKKIDSIVWTQWKKTSLSACFLQWRLFSVTQMYFCHFGFLYLVGSLSETAWLTGSTIRGAVIMWLRRRKRTGPVISARSSTSLQQQPVMPALHPDLRVSKILWLRCHWI